MTSIASPRDTGLISARRVQIDTPALALWALPFTLVFYLGVRGGGYDELVRGAAGVIVWWVVLVGAGFALLPTLSFGWRGWLGVALLGAFVTWTGLSSEWSASPGRSSTDLAKVAAYLGFFVLALALQRGRHRRQIINGAATAVAALAVIAVLSRLRSEWFPSLEFSGTYLDAIRLRRLAYPLNYWNGLAALVSMGVPLVLHAATSARTRVLRAGGLVVVPVMVLCVYLTASRGIVVWLPAGVMVYLALTPRRVWAAAYLTLTGAGSALLLIAAEQRDALQSGVATAASRSEAQSLLDAVLLVGGGVALVAVALMTLEEHGAPRAYARPAPGPRQRRLRLATAVGAAVAVTAIAVAAGAPSRVGDQWQAFKAPSVPTAVNDRASAVGRLQSASGNGRYQYWQSAVAEQQSSPLKGTGSGTFELWWAQHGTSNGGYVRDAHSLFLQTYGELGWVGLVLLGGWLLLVLVAGASGALRAPRVEDRGLYAAATAACASFVSSAAFEWTWQIAVIPALLMLMAGIAMAPGDALDRTRPHRKGHRIIVGAVALASVVVSLLPLMGVKAIRDSQAMAASGDVRGALIRADDAVRLRPSAAAPRLQQALVLEALGDLRGAERGALQAVAREPSGWRNYLVLSRLRTRVGNADGAVQAYRMARKLNPRSPIFRGQS